MTRDLSKVNSIDFALCPRMDILGRITVGNAFFIPYSRLLNHLRDRSLGDMSVLLVSH